MSPKHLGNDVVPPFDLGHWTVWDMAGQQRSMFFHLYDYHNIKTLPILTKTNQGLMVITACNIITGLSALSMSAISTNGQIAAGGVYYMISRCVLVRRSQLDYKVLPQGSWAGHWRIYRDYVHSKCVCTDYFLPLLSFIIAMKRWRTLSPLERTQLVLLPLSVISCR